MKKDKTGIGRVVELDALRGIAALFVLIFHFSKMSNSINPVLALGVTGVDLFFLISGFVIFMTLSKTRTSIEFILSRVLRLFPTFIIMLGVTLLIIFFFNRSDFPNGKTILANLTMMQPLFFAKYIDDSYWTLTVEMQFYILMLLLFMLKWLDNIQVVGGVILGLLMIYYIIAYYFFYDSIIYITPRSLLPIISHFELFYAGIIFYQIKQKGRSVQQTVILLCCLICSLFLFDKSGRAHFFIDLGSYTFMIVLYFLIFYLFVLGKLKFLNQRILLFLGNISYGLYLIHQEAGSVLYNYFVSGNLLSPAVAKVLLFLVMILIAGLVTYLIERPVRSLKKYLTKNLVRQTPEYASDGIFPQG